MSKDVLNISNTPPAYLQKLAYVDSGLGAGLVPKAPKLGITQAKEFTITRDGQKMILPSKTVRVVLVASASNITKAWYAKSFTPGSTEAPDCYSNDGKVPAAGVANKQSSNCATCPKNAFGSHPTTGRGKACSDRKLVVLVWEGEPETLMTMNLPTMSMQSLKRIDEQLKQANIPPQAVLLELKFDQGYTYPVVQMGAVGFVDEATATRLIALKDSDEVMQLLREEVESTEEAPAKEEQAVPQKVIAFGQSAPAQEAQEAPPEPAKRTRRTKAQIEADNAAKARSAALSPEELAEAGGLEETTLADLRRVASGKDEPDIDDEDSPEEGEAPKPTSNVLSLIQQWKTQ